ncbi:ImmA/IrrE family metallo-endopeptidase [Lysinibacillus halotolerans]
MNIKKLIGKLVKKYGTSNPFKLAELLGITVVFEPLGSIHGYYSRTHRTKVIHINENLPYKKQLSTCAHELGHAILHPEENTAFLKANTYFPTSKIESEANEFMMELLFYQGITTMITICDAVESYGIPMELLASKNTDEKIFYL